MKTTTSREACIDAIKKAKSGTARELEKTTGFPMTTLSSVLTDMFYGGLADRENIGSAAAPKFRYSWNDVQKAARTRPAPIPRKNKATQDIAAKKAIADAKARFKTQAIAKTPKPVAKNSVAETQPGDLGSLLDALANRIADTLVERIVSGVESRLASSFRAR